MRPFALFLAYLLLALIAGAMLAWPLHLILYPFARIPLDDLMTRTAMLIALIGAPWFLRWLGLANRPALGYDLPRRDFVRRMSAGVLAGVAILAPLVLTLLALEVRIIEPDLQWSWPVLAQTLLQGLLSGLLIGLIEETFFRGALFTAIDCHSGAPAAVILSSLLYAALHFIGSPPLPPDTVLHWYSGLAVLAQSFGAFATPAAIIDSFAALFMAGAFLAIMRHRTGYIAWCIGLHAGWVLAIQVAKDYTDFQGAASLAFLVGDYDHITGLLAMLWIALLALLYVRLSAPRASAGI